MKAILELLSLVWTVLFPMTANDYKTKYDGVYMSAAESCWQGERLEIDDGRFRYWLWSDVPSKDEFPKTGPFGDPTEFFVLQSDEIELPRRRIRVVQGVITIWQATEYDAFEKWRNDEEHLPWDVLFKVSDDPNAGRRTPIPTLSFLGKEWVGRPKSCQGSY